MNPRLHAPQSRIGGARFATVVAAVCIAGALACGALVLPLALLLGELAGAAGAAPAESAKGARTGTEEAAPR